MGSANSKRAGKRGQTVIRPMSKVALDEVKKYYKIESHALGKGAFGKVFKAESITDNTFTVAIKVLTKRNMSESDIKELGSEVQILNSLDHPNIVKYYEVYEDKKSLYLVMEY
jgi:calcium-dependent protein kinase